MRVLWSLRLLLAVVVAAGVVAGPWASSPAFAKPPKKPPAGKADTTPPVIDHAPLTKHQGVAPVVVEAKITDDKSGVFEPTLLVRAAGSGPFMRVTMTPKDGEPDVYVAEVPKELLAADVEYLIEAFDQSGNGPSRVGDEATPLKIARDVPVVEKPPPPTPPPTTPPTTTPEDGPSGAVIGAGIAVGAVVLIGAAVGGAFLFYSLRPAAPEVVAIKVSGPSPIGGAE
jgi:hypothetical protein